MKRLLTIAIVLLTTLLASAQNGTLNPTNPPEPSAKYKLTVTCQPAEAATTSGSGEYEQGKSVTVRATAKTNYKFKYWLKDGVQQSTTATSFSYTMTAADVKFVAVFEYVEPTPAPYDPSNPAEPQVIPEPDPTFPLYLVASPTGACTFNRTSGATLKAGVVVTVKATPATGYKFDGWYSAAGQRLSTAASFSYTMPAEPTTLTARLHYDPTNPNDPQGGNQTDVDNEDDVPIIDVSDSELTFDAEGGTQTIHISTNRAWTIESPFNWCIVNGNSTYNASAGEYDLDVTVEQNNSTNERSTSITIRTIDNTLSWIVTVRQAGIVPNFTVTPKTFNIPASGGYQTLHVSSNVTWCLTCSDNYIIAEKAHYETNGIQSEIEVRVQMAANPSPSSRQATITFRVENDVLEPIEVVATQAGTALPGDLNDDKDVDGTDLVLLTNLILTGRTNTSGDLNSDGAVDGTDYVLMVNKILGITQ